MTSLNVYAGADGEFVLYEDDGRTIDDTLAGALWTSVRWDDKARTLTLEPKAKSTLKINKPRRFEVLLLPRTTRKSVDYAGQRVDVKFD